MMPVQLEWLAAAASAVAGNALATLWYEISQKQPDCTPGGALLAQGLTG